MKKRFTLSLVLFFFGVSLFAQNSTQGKEFWFSFMQNGYRQYHSNYPEWVELTAMITAKRACTGSIKRVGSSTESISFSVEDNGVVFVEIPELWAYNEGNEEEIDNKAVVLTASDTVSVFISNVADYSFDASFVLPLESLGSEYIIQTDQQSKDGNANDGPKETSAFLIVAVEDDTEVEIMPAVTTLKGHGAGVPYTISMSAGQTYFVRSNNNSEWRDFSGSTVFALNGKKIAVFNGNTITRIPNDAKNGRDHIFEQAMPLDSWGRRFVVTSSAGRVHDIVKITSSADDNTIYCDGEEIAIIGFGDSFEFDLLAEKGSCFIETSQPSIVYLYHTSWEDPIEPSLSRLGDPSMVWIPPIEQRIKEITFCVFENEHEFASITNQYVTIVVHHLDVEKVYLDGELISSADFQPVYGSNEFCFARKTITLGAHNLLCESGLNAYVYGFGEAVGYAYGVGANVLTVNAKMYVNGLWSKSYHDGLYTCKGDSVKMLLVSNYFVNQVKWDFGDGQMTQGEETSHLFDQPGEYLTMAYVTGFNTITLEPIEDTLSMAIHVGEPYIVEGYYVECDSVELFGRVFDHSVYYEMQGTNIYGCDSSYLLTINIVGYTPDFEIQGNHWPIGGNEVYISRNEYSVQLDNPLSELDTVIWRVDCPNWLLEPHGKGETCTLSIYSFLLDPVALQATVINNCDTVCKSFPIQTSYYDVEENGGLLGFEVYPNPTDGHLIIRFGNLKEVKEVSVYNSLGQRIDSFSVDVGSCNDRSYFMPELNNGLYYFVMRCDGMVVTRKVMLNR